MFDSIWRVAPFRSETEILWRQVGLPPEIAQILVNRNIRDPDAARRFLNGTLEELHDPYLMAGMEAAVERVRAAVSRKEKILIFGDYDVDGILSVVMLIKALESLGGDVDYYIPERLTEGYGLKGEHIRVAVEKGAGLVISVDCGIKAHDFVRRAGERGIDVIITDHHLSGPSLPEALAVLNPVLESSGYPERNLAGVGVVFKLIQALLLRVDRASFLPHYLKLVSIGTVADVAELRGENRLFVRHGLKALENVSNMGLKSLLDLCGLNRRRISPGDVGFRIGPRINAAGRMGMTDLAVRLFLTESLRESRELSRRLDELNAQRQGVEERIFNQALAMIKEKTLHDRYKVMILGSEEWHRGVIGIVASRLKDCFYRPILLFAYEDGKAHGSGRSISEFSLINCLDACPELFVTYGGHPLAVGCVLPLDKMCHLKRSLNSFAETHLTGEDVKRKIDIDVRVRFSDINCSLLESYLLLYPFGIGNPTPVFLSEGVEVAGSPQVINNRHVKFAAQQEGRVFESIGWEKGELAARLRRGDRIDMAFTLQFSEFKGEKKIYFSLEDIRG